MVQLLLVIILGMCIGSFLNVCIARVPRGESIISPGSHCMHCGHQLTAIELIPVLSYLGLKGHCKQCHAKITSRYMCIEVLTGIGFGMIYWLDGMSIEALIEYTFLALAIVLAVIDWEHMLLPSSIIFWGMILGILEKIIQSILLQDGDHLVASILGAVMGYTLFAMLYQGSKWILKKEGLGYGDVRLMGLVGFFVGIQYLFIAVFIAALMATIYGFILLSKSKQSEPYPLGPFLNVGACIGLFWGEQIISQYIAIF